MTPPAGRGPFFNRERLIMALKMGKICADDDTISKLDSWLFHLKVTYSSIQEGYLGTRPKPSKELKQLNNALSEWLNSEKRAFDENLFRSFGPLKLTGSSPMVMLSMVARTISETVTWLESGPKKSKKDQSLQTDLGIGLYEGYVELSGNEGLGETGPGVKFMKECASILGTELPRGGRRTLQKAIAAREKRGERRTWADSVSSVWKNGLENT
jgi:hypothetical protein